MIAEKNKKYRIYVGNQIKESRMKQGTSMEQLAELSCTSKNNIFRIEHGIYSAGIDLIGIIADALGLVLKLEEK